MPVVADIMTSSVAFIQDRSTLREARKALKELNIRHLPVVSGEGVLVGLLTQRVVLAEVIRLVDQSGVAGLERSERELSVTEVMLTDFQITDPGMDLKDAGQFFLDNKHSCLPVVEQGRLIGMLTAQDFVKLCVRLL